MQQSLAVVRSRVLVGIQAPEVTVETHITFGLPRFTIVGLPEKAVKESKDRVRSAILNSQFEFAPRKITVNLAPADLPKESGRLDLPIAIGILAATQQIPITELDRYEFVGELALSGELRAVTGILPIAIQTYKSNKILVLPKENAAEARLIERISIIPVSHLNDIVKHLLGQAAEASEIGEGIATKPYYSIDMAEVIGQSYAKRALLIAAAGGHSLLMCGPPGSGKTMLASRLPTILPELTNEEALETAAVTSISHTRFSLGQWRRRPFRAPHHSASSVALVGGGNPPKPGEISLAHQGVLFLDELPEFSRGVLEAMREPLESGVVTISRAARQCEFPAQFQLIAAMNPCPCGYHGDNMQACRCTPDQIQRYHNKLSGPLLDRIDLFIQVPRIDSMLLTEKSSVKEMSSSQLQQQVIQARAYQIKRSGKTNARLSPQALQEYCQLDEVTKELMQMAMRQLNLSARAYHRVLKVARTIADLAESENILKAHIQEALSYRSATFLQE